MVVLLQLLSIITPEIARTERNAKSVRKDTQPFCMVINQRKVRLSSWMVTLEKNQKKMLITQQLTLNLMLLACL